MQPHKLLFVLNSKPRSLLLVVRESGSMLRYNVHRRVSVSAIPTGTHYDAIITVDPPSFETRNIWRGYSTSTEDVSKYVLNKILHELCLKLGSECDTSMHWVLMQHGTRIELKCVLAFESCIKHMSNTLASYSEPSLREIALPMSCTMWLCM